MAIVQNDNLRSGKPTSNYYPAMVVSEHDKLIFERKKNNKP